MRLLAIDTETGGLVAGKNALLSVSMVSFDTELEGFEDTLDVFIKPEDGEIIDPQAARVNGYTPELWEKRGAVNLANALYKIAAWIPRGSLPLAHNAGFDRGFLDAAERKADINLYMSYQWHCSQATFRAVNTALALGFKKVGLDTLAKACGYWTEDFVRGDHNSLEDAKACAMGYKWLLKKIAEGRTDIVADPQLTLPLV